MPARLQRLADADHRMNVAGTAECAEIEEHGLDQSRRDDAERNVQQTVAAEAEAIEL